MFRRDYKAVSEPPEGATRRLFVKDGSSSSYMVEDKNSKVEISRRMKEDEQKAELNHHLRRFDVISSSSNNSASSVQHQTKQNGDLRQQIKCNRDRHQTDVSDNGNVNNEQDVFHAAGNCRLVDYYYY